MSHALYNWSCMRHLREFVSGLVYLTCHAALAAPGATYHHDIAPILREHCVSCHQQGQPGPFSLITYEDVRKRASQIADVTRRRYMPPWLPDRTSPPFVGENHLSDAQIAAIASWVAAGSPEGVRGTVRPVPKTLSGWQLGTQTWWCKQPNLSCFRRIGRTRSGISS